MTQNIFWQILDGLTGPTLLLAIYLMLKILGLQKEHEKLTQLVDEVRRSRERDEKLSLQRFDLLIAEIRELRSSLQALQSPGAPARSDN